MKAVLCSCVIMLEFLLISCRQIPNEYKEYLHEYSVPVEYREVFPIHGEGRLKIPEIISREQAKEDVLMMEYLIRTSYAGYEYWITKGVDFNAFYQGIFENLDKNDSVTTYDLEKELSNIFNNIYDGHIALGGRVHNWAYKHKAAYFCDIIVEKENDGTYKVIDSKNPSVKEGDTFTQVNPEQFLFRTLSSERVKLISQNEINTWHDSCRLLDVFCRANRNSEATQMSGTKWSGIHLLLYHVSKTKFLLRL